MLHKQEFTYGDVGESQWESLGAMQIGNVQHEEQVRHVKGSGQSHQRGWDCTVLSAVIVPCCCTHFVQERAVAQATRGGRGVTHFAVSGSVVPNCYYSIYGLLFKMGKIPFFLIQFHQMHNDDQTMHRVWLLGCTLQATSLSRRWCMGKLTR